MENPSTMTEITNILNKEFNIYTKLIKDKYCGSSFGRQVQNALYAAGYKIVKIDDNSDNKHYDLYNMNEDVK